MAGSTSFVGDGLLAGKVGLNTGNLLLVLLVFGAAKAALMPLHAWLPSAMVAPAPVSALLHAVAVVKAGVFTILKISAYTFGPDLVAQLPAAQWLLWIAAASIVIASIIAMTKDDLKARLAWSTVAQLSYVTSAALLPLGAGLVAGGLHMLFHAVAKITLFMCAGAVYVATGASRVSETQGLGRTMPVVFACFLVASLSVIGLPPFAGMWSKFLLISSSLRWREWATAGAMIVSSLLGLIYLAPIGLRALLPPAGDAGPREFIRPGGAAGPMVAALVITAGACLALFFLADFLAGYLAPLKGGVL
jgi:multicomponent Na+:H+ antiporter subunit D